MAKKVLIIEDEEMLANMYAEKLEAEGFETSIAASSSEGIETARKEQPDAILLDMLLQDENGLAFLWKQQEEKDLQYIPVVVFSNYDDNKMRTEATRLGAKDYLIKTDYTPQEIIERIKAYIPSSNNQ